MLTSSDLRMLAQFDEGIFKSYFAEFIEFRHGRGEKIHEALLRYMKDINNILCTYSSEKITKDMANSVFHAYMDSEGLVHHSLLSTMRAFTLYMSAMIPDTFVVPEKYWGTRRIGTRNYVFTKEELAAVIAATDAYCRESRFMKPYYGDACPYPVIVRILAGTGMRISEVRNLARKDVDTENGIIIVRDGKAHVSRFVPVSESLASVLMKHCTKTNPSDRGKGFLFPSSRTGNAISLPVLENVFRRIFSKAGLEAKNGEKPVIHTFRHTFCTHAIDRMLASGMHPDTAVPLLAAYAGHTDLRVTYRYLHMTDSVIEDFYASEAVLSDLIPDGEEESYEW